MTAQRSTDDALAAAREELRDSEIKYRLIASHIPGAVYRTSGGPDSRELFLGEQIEGICGYSAKELMAGPVTCMTVIHPDDRALVNATTAAAIAARQPYVVDYRIIHRDGSIRWLQDKGQAVFGEDGQPLFLDGVVLRCYRAQAIRSGSGGEVADLRARKPIEPWSPTFPASSIAASSMPIGPTFYVSDYSETLTGYPASDFIDQRVRSYASITHPDDAEMIARTVAQAVEQRRPFELDYRVLHRDGKARWVREYAQVVFDFNGQPVYLDGIIFDITDRKAFESHGPRQGAGREREAWPSRSSWPS